ncbi:hypothetical protein Pelo_17392 [Pelomyxa schiedti]|nr:hypothetical protein Pelo_17392 [Pelomyxa schiedti]
MGQSGTKPASEDAAVDRNTCCNKSDHNLFSTSLPEQAVVTPGAAALSINDDDVSSLSASATSHNVINTSPPASGVASASANSDNHPTADYNHVDELLTVSGDGQMNVGHLPQLDVEGDTLPHVISFLGDTQTGKSFLIDKLLYYLPYNKSLPRPRIGNEINSTTMGVHFYNAGDTLLLDFEGSDGTGSPSEVVDTIFPRLAYSISSTIVYLTTSRFAKRSTIDNLCASLKVAAQKEANGAYIRPSLVVVFNNSGVIKSDEELPIPREQQSLFSAVSHFFLSTNKDVSTFQNQLDILSMDQTLSLPSHHWISLFIAVVEHFNHNKSVPVVLCKLYASLIDNLPPLHRVQRLLLSRIPNRVCTVEEFSESCQWAKRALPAVIATHLHSTEQVADLGQYCHRNLSLLRGYCSKFVPCFVNLEHGRCCVQHVFHSSQAHEFVAPDLQDDDNTEGIQLLETTRRFMEALANVATRIDLYPVCGGQWDETAVDHPLELRQLLRQFNAVDNMSALYGLRYDALRYANGAIRFLPFALVGGLISGGSLFIPYLVLGTAISVQHPELPCSRTFGEETMELMAQVALEAFVKGWNYLTLVANDHVTFILVKNKP